MHGKEKSSDVQVTSAPSELDDAFQIGETINESGHVQVMERRFSLLSLCCLGVSFGNVWPILGGALVIALANGGMPGVIYQYIFTCFFYVLIAACFAEMASSVPSSSGVYQWASVTAGPRYGRVAGFFAGWWNLLGYLFGCVGGSLTTGQMIVSMYGVMHPEYVYQRWHVYIVQVCTIWVCCSIVLFCNRALPALAKLSLVLIVGGFFITVLVCAIMPSQTGKGYATSHEVWVEWQNQTGWSNNVLVFCMGTLNAVVAVGTPTALAHLAEELPRPRVNMPKAQLAMYAGGLPMGFIYLIAIFYAVTDRSDLLSTNLPFPLAEVYRQATNSRAGSVCLVFVIFATQFCSSVGIYLVLGRILWSLARDNATPFSSFFAQISPRFGNPFNATLASGIFATLIGAIGIGSTTALVALGSAFILFSSATQLLVLVPNILNRRRYLQPGPFRMPAVVYYPIAGISCIYAVVFMVIYSFPPVMPFDEVSMNYSSVMFGGSTILLSIWWLWIRNKRYDLFSAEAVGGYKLLEHLY